MTDEDRPEESTAKASGNSIAIGGISIGGNVGDIRIGHTTGYTAEEVSILITQIKSTFQPKPFDGRSPYKGLDVFEEEDAELFFGREMSVDDLVRRVKESRTVFVTGPSGSGKSSLVRAGLIPALKQDAIKNSDRWLYDTMKPGRDPLAELARVTSRLAGTTNAEDEVRLKAMTDETIFARWCEIALKDGRDKRVVLFIDQFEEIFTQISKEEERVAFLNLLTYAATVESGRMIILFSMRSDFVSNCATYPQLNALLNQQFVQIGAMQPEELVSAMAQPALRVGLRIDPDLIAQVINDMKGEPGALPLMQFTLKDLFDTQQAKGGVIALTLNDYLQHGGIQKSLERHADAAFAKLEANEQELARSIFSSLIEIGRGTQDTKRTALFEELVPVHANAEDVHTVVGKLADARLVTTDEQAGKDTITISHEKLIDAWPWLRKLVNENRDTIALQNEIVSDAKEWGNQKRDTSYLYTGARLANAREHLDAKKIVLSGLAQEFVLAALAKQRRGQLALISGVLTIIALSVVAVIVFGQQATINAETASTAQAANTFAVAQQATAQSASTQAVAQEVIARANAEESQKQANIALARLLAAQAESINATRSSKQLIAVLLGIQSTKLFPTWDANTFLINNNLSAVPVNRMTHDSFVNSVAFSSDGRYVVSGSEDNTARVWEVKTGKEVARMTHDGSVTSVAFSPDGKYVVSGSWDNTARVWEAQTGKEVARMTHDVNVDSVAFSPDGKYVVSGSAGFTASGFGDFTARVWEAQTGKEIARMTHDGFVTSVAFSPDGRYVVSGGWDHTARVWEAHTGKEVAHMIHDGDVDSVAFSPDGKYIVSGSADSFNVSVSTDITAIGFADSTARVWEAQTGKEIARMIHDGPVYSVAFSPDGKYVVSGSEDKTARVWEATTGKEVARMTHNDRVTYVAFSGDGKYVVSSSWDNTARVWEAQTGKEVARMTHDNPVISIAFSQDGKYVVSGSEDKTAQVWEVVTGKEVVRMTHDHVVGAVVFSPDGKYAVSGGCDKQDKEFAVICIEGTARVWEVETGKEVARMTHSNVVTSVAFSPDGRYVVSGSGDSTARVWEVETGKEVARMTHDDWVNSVAFSPDGRYVVSGSEDNTARVWEVKTGKEVARMTHDGGVTSVAFSPDDRYVVSGSWDNTARVWEVATGKEVARMTHDHVVGAVVFSPDGKYVASSGGVDKTARVWEAQTGKEVARMTHDGFVNSVAFSSDGKYIVSGSDDNTARVWEAQTGKVVARMTHDGDVGPVAFSPDGKFVVSASYDIRIWEVATGKEVARITHDSYVFFVTFSPDGKYIVSGSMDEITRGIWRPDDLIADACSHLSRNLNSAEWKQYVGDALPYQAVCPNLPIEPEPKATP